MTEKLYTLKDEGTVAVSDRASSAGHLVYPPATIATNEDDVAVKKNARRPLPAGTFVKTKPVDLPPQPRGIPTPEERRAYLNKRKKFLARKVK